MICLLVSWESKVTNMSRQVWILIKWCLAMTRMQYEDAIQCKLPNKLDNSVKGDNQTVLLKDERSVALVLISQLTSACVRFGEVWRSDFWVWSFPNTVSTNTANVILKLRILCNVVLGYLGNVRSTWKLVTLLSSIVLSGQSPIVFLLWF